MAPPRKLATVAATGNRVDTLIALRDKLARAIDADPPARDLAPLSRQFRDVVAELAEIQPERADPVDDFSARLAARRSATQAQ